MALSRLLYSLISHVCVWVWVCVVGGGGGGGGGGWRDRNGENRNEVRIKGRGYLGRGKYRRDIHCRGATLSQLASLTSVSSRCEQFIKYECYHSLLLGRGYAWWESRDSAKMTYWWGASPGSRKCACVMNNTCADPKKGCNSNKNDRVWCEDSGLLTDKTKLPVKRLVHGDAGGT